MKVKRGYVNPVILWSCVVNLHFLKHNMTKIKVRRLVQTLLMQKISENHTPIREYYYSL